MRICGGNTLRNVLCNRIILFKLCFLDDKEHCCCVQTYLWISLECLLLMRHVILTSVLSLPVQLDLMWKRSKGKVCNEHEKTGGERTRTPSAVHCSASYSKTQDTLELMRGRIVSRVYVHTGEPQMLFSLTYLVHSCKACFIYISLNWQVVSVMERESH